MRSVSVHVVIFSPNYARSPWCLAELCFMLKTGAKIIPVFHHVDPSDLRCVTHGKGSYASAFSEYEEKDIYSSEKLQEWKMALESVSSIFGFVIKNNDDDGEISHIANIVYQAMGKLPFEPVEHPVGKGLDCVVRELEKSILESAKSESNVQIVGILGMEGVGKTTLAKELYKQKRSAFHYCSFIYDVRDAGTKGALHEEQKRLLKDMGVRNEDSSFDNVERGKVMLSSRLRSMSVLIVLDDVDHEDQFNALLPAIDSLGSGSLIIVTSSDLGVLTKCGISSNAIYKMSGLNQHHAEQLFCGHAFLQSHPKEGFQDLVRNYLIHSGGLSLSLKEHGEQVYKMSMDDREAQDVISNIGDNSPRSKAVETDDSDSKRKQQKIRVKEEIAKQWIYMLASDQIGWRAFDPFSRRWKRLPDMPSDHCFASGDKESLCAGTQLLVLGREIEGLVIWRYDLLSNKWYKGPAMLNPRYLYASASFGSFGFVAGGISATGELLNTAERYDCDNQRWEPLENMNKKRKLCSGCYMDGKFYVIGGTGEEGDLSCGEVYDFEKNSWELIENMKPTGPRNPISQLQVLPLIAVANNELYSLEALTSQLKVYIKTTNKWKALGEVPVRADFTSGWGVAFKSLGNELLVIGGNRDPSQSMYGHGISIYTCRPDPNVAEADWRFLTRVGESNRHFVFNCAIMTA
ncbi:hypothetical protein SUGI_0128340 [Cryptomeria japonica]|nr:hypothetical protein SUGI_0128340 [Cryptomeria japonica]